MSRIFLILVLAIIPVVDWLVPFHETQQPLVFTGETQLGGLTNMAGASWWEHDPELNTLGPGLRLPSFGDELSPTVQAVSATSRFESDPLPTAPEGEVSDRSTRPPGVQGIVTYVHPSLSGGVMRDGVTRYDPEGIGPVAATSWPLGTWLEIRGPSGRVLTAVVSDTGHLGPGHIDASEAMFRVLSGGSLDAGVISVEIREAK